MPYSQQILSARFVVRMPPQKRFGSREVPWPDRRHRWRSLALKLRLYS